MFYFLPPKAEPSILIGARTLNHPWCSRFFKIDVKSVKKVQEQTKSDNNKRPKTQSKCIFIAAIVPNLVTDLKPKCVHMTLGFPGNYCPQHF